MDNGDDDGLSNLAEYEVAINWGPENFTDPSDPDTDNDGINDGMEFFGFYYGLTEFNCLFIIIHKY